MGEVYRAEDTRLRRQVAVKFLPAQFSFDPEFKRRFEQEAVAAAGLNHANITTIYELAEHEGRLFIAMELLEGEPLDRLIASGTLTLPQMLDVAAQVCQGLARAHEAGIIHRDIKPSNIFVGTDGRVKILDFGLAHSVDQAPPDGPHQAAGTLPYESPEQLAGEHQDARSDLYSLGALLYEMAAGRPPFEADFADAMRYAILHDSPQALSDLSPGIPPRYQEIVHRLLAKSPADRYRNASDLLADLNLLCCDMEGRPGGQAAKWPYRRPSIAVLPFANLTNDPAQQYLGEGIAEEIIHALARVAGLDVAARTSSFVFKPRAEDIRSIGRRLNVSTVLEGSVSRTRQRLRIIAQLIRVEDGFHIWSERYERSDEDIFAIQEEIAARIVGSLELILSEKEREALSEAPTSNAKAYDFYLRGRQYVHSGRRQSLLFAMEMFQRAVEADPAFVLAYVEMANTIALLVHYFGESKEAPLELADRASSKAVELAPKLAAALGARGFVLWVARRSDEADRLFELAIEKDPDLFEARYYYGRSCFQRRRLEQAADLFEAACRVHEHHEARYFAAQTYTALERPHRAQATYRMALQDIENHLELNPDDARVWTMGAVTLCRLGDADRGLEWAERALRIDPQDAGIQYNAACLFALEGHTDRALQCLEAAVQAGFAHRDWVEQDPDLDSLREHPRFRSLPWRSK